MTTRHKYRYKSRELAEDAQAKTAQESHLNYRAMLALYTGEVDWLPSAPADTYRVGIYDKDSMAGAKVIVAFDPKTGQRVHLAAYDAYDWSRDMIDHYNTLPPSPSDAEGNLLRNLAYRVRQEI